MLISSTEQNLHQQKQCGNPNWKCTIASQLAGGQCQEPCITMLETLAFKTHAATILTWDQTWEKVHFQAVVWFHWPLFFLCDNIAKEVE